jgi:type IV fimbrial biogenesis protein FimT
MLGKCTQHGVSLVELMVAIIIASLLFALAVPSYNGWIQNQQIRNAAESILNGIQLARSEAVKNNRSARLALCDLPSSSWEVLAASTVAPAPAASLACGAGSNAAAGEIRVQERTGQEGSRQAQLTVTPNGATTVTFNSLGRVVANADGSAAITQVDVATTTGDRPMRIMIGVGGNARMCDPSPLLAAGDPRRCN